MLGPNEIMKSQELIDNVRPLHFSISRSVHELLTSKTSEDLSQAVKEGHGDVSYKIDVHVEDKIEEYLSEMAKKIPLVATAEGIGRKQYGTETPKYELLIDPIDGTRGIMYDIRSSWVLTGIAKHVEGEIPNLSDIEVAIQTEIPTSKQNIISYLYAIKGQGAWEEKWDIINNKLISKNKLVPSQADTIKHGFSTFVNYFPGVSEDIGRISEAIYKKVLGPVEKGKALVFDDQYICSAGQLYLLASGKYRFVADLRPRMEKLLNSRGLSLGMAAHPYDLSTLLIAKEAGAIVTDLDGNEPTYPFDTTTSCGTLGFANQRIFDQLFPALQEELSKLPK